MVWRLLEGGAYLRPVAYTESLDDKVKVEVSIYSKPYIPILLNLQNIRMKNVFKRTEKQPREVFCKKRCSWKFCKFDTKSPVLESLLKKLLACNFIKKRLQHTCFPVKFTKFLRTPILKNSCERLLLQTESFKWNNSYNSTAIIIKTSIY